jgi:hypothetical protein
LAITEDEIKNDFSKLSDKSGRNYEKEIGSWITKKARFEDFEELEGALRKLLHAGDFDAFFALATLYRRYYKSDDLRKLINDYEKPFLNYGLLVSHLRVMALNLEGGKENCREALKLAERIWTESKEEHAGIGHSYAESVAKCVQEGYVDRSCLADGMKAIRKAIELDRGYAKFYRTRGWLHFLLGEPEEGQRCYQEAIRYEKPGTLDFGIRLAEYRRELDSHNAEQKLRELQKGLAEFQEKAKGDQAQLSEKLTKLQEKAEEIQVRQVEFLGFFTGLLALLLGEYSIMKNSNYEASFALMLTLGGMLLIVFVGFGFILHGPNEWRWRSILPFLVGALLLGLGYWGFNPKSATKQEPNSEVSAGNQKSLAKPSQSTPGTGGQQSPR